MLLGKILASAAAMENKYVTWMPSYGAEVRGGAAYCMVVVSTQEIGSPYIEEADSMIIMNAPSLKKFASRLKSGGLILINSSLAKDISKNNIKKAVYPFTDLAFKLGNIKVANIIALGCFLKIKKLIRPISILSIMKKFAPPDKKELLLVNEKALKEGMHLA
jgi:2-oxoglutarate ferredoxin oxidoreductase subunit gamma